MSVQTLDVRSRIVGLIRVRSDEVLDHPRQHRTHGDRQISVLRELLQTVGQADVLIVYRSPQLGNALVAIDGHGRKNETGVVEWDAIELDVDDDEADLILATLDATTAMAGTSKERFAELYDSLPVQREAVQLMLDDMLGARMPDKDLAFGGVGAPEADGADGAEAGVEGLAMGIPVSAVRMVQLYLDGTTHPELMEMVDDLSQRFGTNNITQTVMSAVRYAHDRVVADGGEAGDLSRYVGDAGSGMANDDVLAPIREGRAMAALDGTATFAAADLTSGEAIDLTEEAEERGIPPFPTMDEGIALAVEAGVPPEDARAAVEQAHLDVTIELTEAKKAKKERKAAPAIYERAALDHVCADCGQEYTMEQASTYDNCIDCGGPIVPITDAEPSA
jgi:hypothetical protein